MFSYCKSLINLNLSNFNTQNVTDMSYMFCDCKSLTNLNLSNFNTQNVTDMSGMFRDCKSLNKKNLITKDNKVLEEFDLKYLSNAFKILSSLVIIFSLFNELQ